MEMGMTQENVCIVRLCTYDDTVLSRSFVRSRWQAM